MQGRSGVTVPPPPAPGGMPPGGYWQPPPQKPGMPAWAIVVIVVVVVLVVVAVMAAVLYVMVSGLTSPPDGEIRPVVTFSSPGAIPNGFEFQVAAVDQSRDAASFRGSLQVNASAGTAVTLSATMSFTIGGNTYSVAWTDIGGEGDLTGGDFFRVTRTGGLPLNTDFTFRILWFDGSQIASATYST